MLSNHQTIKWEIVLQTVRKECLREVNFWIIIETYKTCRDLYLSMLYNRRFVSIINIIICKHSEWLHVTREKKIALINTDRLTRIVRKLTNSTTQQLSVLLFIGRKVKNLALQELFQITSRKNLMKALSLCESIIQVSTSIIQCSLSKVIHLQRLYQSRTHSVMKSSLFQFDERMSRSCTMSMTFCMREYSVSSAMYCAFSSTTFSTFKVSWIVWKFESLSKQNRVSSSKLDWVL